MIQSNQSAINAGISNLRQKLQGGQSWTYGDQSAGPSEAQRQAGQNAQLLRSGPGGIAQLLGLPSTAQGGRAGAYIGAGAAAQPSGGPSGGSVLSGLMSDTGSYLNAPTYQAPAAAVKPPRAVSRLSPEEIEDRKQARRDQIADRHAR
jgi:hypothetical protein